MMLHSMQVLGLDKANSTEFDSEDYKTPNPVVIFMPEVVTFLLLRAIFILLAFLDFF